MFFPQASAVWQWWNYYMAQLPTGKVPLRINLDETSICLFQGHSKGTILVGGVRGPFRMCRDLSVGAV